MTTSIKNTADGFIGGIGGSGGTLFVGGAPLNIVIDPPAAENVDDIDVTINLQDGSGNNITSPAIVWVYISSDADGATLANTGSPRFAFPTGSLIFDVAVDHAVGIRSDNNGVIVLRVTQTGAATFYIVALDALGRTYVSDALVFTA